MLAIPGVVKANGNGDKQMVPFSDVPNHRREVRSVQILYSKMRMQYNQCLSASGFSDV